MSLSIYNIKKWARMLSGKSEMHVHQTIGTQFIPGVLKGYFNNMIEKVMMEPKLVDTLELPEYHAEQGNVVFPVTIFQYALGCYDLYLKNGDARYLNKFLQLASWAVDNQEQNGAWDNFSFIYPHAPYGSMCQGEGSSVLVRAYQETKDQRYLSAAKKAISFMLIEVDNGGCSIYRNNDLFFLEFTHLPVVLNGWIFSIFGLYDLELVCHEEIHQKMLNETVNTLLNYLPKFDCQYWSMYDLGNKIASPFYHNLHISQLDALYQITQNHTFNEYKNRFAKYRNSRICYMRSFLKKAYQKIKE